MLFFNFICLFYLMVLINSHTISKNILHEEKVDDIVDSIHDLEYRRECKPKHDRLNRYYKKEDKEDATNAKEKEGQKIQSTRLMSDASAVSELAKTARTTPKSTKRFGFWHKFRYRGDDNRSKSHKKENELHKRKAMPRRKSYKKQSRNDINTKYEYDDAGYVFDEQLIFSPQRNRPTNVDKRKRDVSNITTIKSIRTRASSTYNPTNSRSTPLFKFSTMKTYEPFHSTDSLIKALSALTTRVDDLKKEYALRLKNNSYPTFTTQTMMKNITAVSPSLVPTTQMTTEDVDFLGTAQIEALLNDIKVKAIQMVAEQSPAVTDMITNTVTETTFEADPILTHISSPGYALSTFISIDNDSPYSKRTAFDTTIGSKVNDTVVIANTESTHQISVRSINEDVFTIAQTIEDMLQKELKKVYNKVKGKMTSQLRDEVHEVKSTAKKQTAKMMKKLTHSDKKQPATRVTTPMTTPKSKPKGHTKKHKESTIKQMRRSPKSSKNMKNKSKTSSKLTQSTVDDYVMLTLFEQILTKTHEDNVMKMLTTPSIASKNHNNFRLFKRTPGTLARVSLKVNEQKLYDDVILPDDLLDYGSKTTNPNSVSTESGAEDTSYEGLSNKISYNDYVNGYKHYLKFQKEQGNQNFSNLVRYQAHRHHSVDDIGKFILNKIPQMQPTKRLKRFFDDDIMEDQDISTKSDDSWFKKHFYLFIDNGPPRKYHTSQTVELKSPTDSDFGSSGTENPVFTPRPKSKGLTENIEGFGEFNNSGQDSIENSLEQISKALDERKSKEFINVSPGQVNKFINEDETKEANKKEYSSENSILKGLGSIGLVDKLFRGKGRRTPKHNVNVDKLYNRKMSKIGREKRYTKSNVDDTDNLFTSRSNTFKSTVPNDIDTRKKNYGYVDVNLIPRPTAIVKLREDKQKKGKFRKFLNKFHFRKRKKHKETKKSERAKRDYRVQRFNPLKKLKEIFNVKQQDQHQHQILEIPDYEMMTSHIDTFKPVKYNKVMSVEEIKGQIPNITEDLSQFNHNEALRPVDKSPSIEVPNLSPDAISEVYDTTPITKISTPSLSELDGTLKQSTRKHPKPRPNLQHQSTFKPLQEFNVSFDMPEATYDPSTNKFENYGTTQTLDDIKSEIDSLQMKLSMPDEQLVSKTSTSLSTTRYPNSFSVKKIYVPPHIQAVQMKTKSNPKVHAKADPKDIKIQTKLTRIAKFPLSHFTHDRSLKSSPVIERPQMYQYADRIGHERSLIGVSQEIRRKKSLNAYVTVSPRYSSSQKYNEYNKEESYNKPYPDYFNDLLMWHGDLLNTDKLTSPQWENILKNLKQDSEISTLSMVDMQRELIQMKDYLKIDESLKNMITAPKGRLKAHPIKSKKEKDGSNMKKSRNIVKTIALKDSTLAKGDDIIIQGEAKYFHVIKQPDQESDKYIKASDLLKDLNKISFKSPAIKYNIDNKIHDAKRNGDFWIDKIGSNKNHEQDSSPILFLDTTLLAYDDGPDYLTEHPKHKIMSKNSLISPKTHSQKQPMPKPVTKSNQSPAQYFSTPLPMRMNDFERFLKDNQLDVQSVTTPLVGMPQFVLNKSPAKNITEKKDEKQKIPASSKKVSLESPLAFVTINPLNLHYNTNKMIMENNAQNQFTIKDTHANKYKEIDDIRQKRYNEMRNERFFTFEPFRRKPKGGKVKKKIKLFDRKATTRNTPYTTLPDTHYSVVGPQNDDDNMHKEVELTIINMNDIDQGYDNKLLDSEEKLKTETPKHITTRANVETINSKAKTKTINGIYETTSFPAMQKIHNKLLYNLKSKDKHKEITTKPTIKPQTTWHFDNNWNDDNNVITDEISSTTFHPMINHKLFSNLQAKHPPKRVRISSHSYKYDIIYNEPKRLSKNTRRAHKYGFRRLIPVENNDDLKSPQNINFQNRNSLTHTIRTSDSKREILKIVRAVEAVENYTKPNVLIHINLPTYYMPETGPTEKIVSTTQRSMWNDFVMKYLSGLALIELLNKFNILNVLDGKMNSTDGMGTAVNASKVFSIAEQAGSDEEKKWRMKPRRSRQVSGRRLGSTVSINSYEGLHTMVPNWREKRRLKLFSNIKGKLKTLLRKKTNYTTVSPKAKTTKKEEKYKTATKLSTIEEHKAKREKHDEIKGEGISTIDDGFNVDYDFDIDRIVERATANVETTKMLAEKTKKMKQKYENLNEMITDAEIPYLSPMVNEEIPTIKDNITSTSYQDLNKKTSTITTTTKNSPLSTIATKIKSKENNNHNSKEEVYFEPLIYDNKIYYEPSSQTPKTNLKQTIETNDSQKLQTKSTETKLEKRDVQPAAKFTARDVAALEVIVDLVKNTVNYEEAVQEYTENYYQSHPSVTTTSAVPKSTVGTNSIQVHIAIPYNLQVDKKRSLDSFNVRRVFAAKMVSPVDLEYQVQSFEDNKRSTTVSEPEDSVKPKMYLLIDANGSLAKGNFPLKPLKGNIDLSKVRVRQVATTKAFATQKAETTSGKSIGRVTLSKDFVAAVNKHLVQLYENLTVLNEPTAKHCVQIREINIFEGPTRVVNAKMGLRRHINWDAVKKYFGHDRVCNCKCKPNRTMCRACAASDAVISELIFEFDNLAKYMNDHCTEIQTFFWMNPSGGKKLRDAVHRVDKTLHDYFKRVKGKCKGCTCKTFSTCIDKRSFVKNKKMPKQYIGNPLIVDLQKLANDIETTSNLGISYTDSLIVKGETLIDTIGNCIKNNLKQEKPNPTTSIATAPLPASSTKKPMVKNVYSLDNINVNIICKPESKVAIVSSTAKMISQSPEVTLETTGFNFVPSLSLYDYDTDEIIYKKRKGFRNFFANKRLRKYKMNDIFTYYVTKEPDTTKHMKVFSKRQTENQIDAPLVADTGGTFWKDYLKGHLLPHDLKSKTINKESITDCTTHKSKENDADILGMKKTKSNERVLTTTANPKPMKHVFQRNVNSTDYSSIDSLSHNINEIFKIFNNLTDLKAIENMSTQTFEPTDKPTTRPAHTKMKTTTKIYKSIKEKLHLKHKSNATKMNTNKTKTTSKRPPTPETKDDTDSITRSDATVSSKASTSAVPTTLIENALKSTTAKIATTVSKASSLKPTTNDKAESSQLSNKVKESSELESNKHETTSSIESEDVTVRGTDGSLKVTDKRVKSNFLTKLKMATLDFFHKVKDLQKTTPIADTNEETRKSRSPATEVDHFENFKVQKNKTTLTKPDDTTYVISEATTENNPTILIINEYDTEMGPESSTDIQDSKHFEDSDTDSSTQLNENIRNLLLSILHYEGKKLSSEWRRIKKDGNRTGNNKRGIFSLYISTESSVKNDENEYDILKTLKDLELPTPKGLDTEKKASGLLQKIANKFGVKVVPSTHIEKPKATSTKLPASQHTTVKVKSTTERQKTKLQQNTAKHQGESQSNAVNFKLKPKKLKLNPKYTSIPQPIVTVNVNSNQEAFKPHPGQICDVDATFKHIQEILQILPRKEVEKYITNKTCDKYKSLPKYFLIDVSHRKRRNKIKKHKVLSSTENNRKWDWIRNKRSLNNQKHKIYNARYKNDDAAPEAKRLDIIGQRHDDFTTENSELESIKTKYGISPTSYDKSVHVIDSNNAKQLNFVIEGNEYFEALEKDVYGIYRNRKKRSKRANDINELEAGLKNLPYSSRPNESYAMLGDSIIIQCITNNKNSRKDNEFRWVTDRKDMLTYDNVIVDGPKLVINEVGARNLGDYTCQKGKTSSQRRVRLTVITLPTFKVVFTPVYSVEGKCTYDDLKAIQLLGPMMSKEICSNDQICSVRVEEPVCLQDRVSNTAYLRLTAVLSVPPNGDVSCSGRCRRDVHNSLALMAAADAPALASVRVIITNDRNKTFLPTSSSDSRRSFVTHTLRRKDSFTHKDDYSHAFSTESVSVIASCPVGYYLISEQKICAACPVGSNCGARLAAHASKFPPDVDGQGGRFRRCYWWYLGCGWCAAGWGAACACAGVAAALHARAPRPRPARGDLLGVNAARTRTPRARPLSPSRVILAKFFRGSRSSTKATDSQETKFGLWKEKNLPPPLPPIDFDS